MRLLFVTPYVPLATKPRPFRFIQHLAKSHEVHLIAFDLAASPNYHERTDFRDLERSCSSITLLPLPKWRRYANAAGSMLSPGPARVAYYGIERFRDQVQAKVEELRIDMIHVDRLRIAGLCAPLALPKVIDATDCISEYLWQCARYALPHLRPAYALEAMKTQRFERSAADAYDRCLITTERDRALLGDATYADRVQVVPNILADELFEHELAAGADPRRGQRVVFVGNLGYLPNVDAVHHLFRTIWPRIVRKMPSARLVLAGDAPHPSVRRLAQDAGATITGFLSEPDLTEVIASAHAVISPMRIGVGFPNKVAESLALGAAVVSSTVGCRGLGDCSTAVAVADDPERFAREVVRLLDDPTARRERGHAARLFAERTFSPAMVRSRLDVVYDRAAVPRTA
jgi:glycosyltransferase involved in cell wall biosynthesis